VGRAEQLARCIERSGVGAVLSRVPAWRGVLVLCYHRIGRPGPGVNDPRLWSATQEEFDGQLQFLARHVQVVSGDELATALEEPRGRHVALTFDDGYRDNYELAYPVLRANGLPAVFFVATGFIDRPHVAWWDEIAWMVRETDQEAATEALLDAYQQLPTERADAFLDRLAAQTGSGRANPIAASSTWMTWDMVREMQRGGMTFGAHTVDHPVLARCPPERQQQEIDDSVARLCHELGEPPKLFSYPVGGRAAFDDRTREALRDAGITHAFSFYGGHVSRGGFDPLDLPRAYVSPTISAARFRARVTLPRVFCRPTPSAAAAGSR